MQRSRSIREVLEALDWVRREMMCRGSPDFIRQRELERRARQLAARLSRGDRGTPSGSPDRVKPQTARSCPFPEIRRINPKRRGRARL